MTLFLLVSRGVPFLNGLLVVIDWARLVSSQSCLFGQMWASPHVFSDLAVGV